MSKFQYNSFFKILWHIYQSLDNARNTHAANSIATVFSSPWMGCRYATRELWRHTTAPGRHVTFVWHHTFHVTCLCDITACALLATTHPRMYKTLLLYCWPRVSCGRCLATGIHAAILSTVYREIDKNDNSIPCAKRIFILTVHEIIISTYCGM
jgi:hypothetical protein